MSRFYTCGEDMKECDVKSFWMSVALLGLLASVACGTRDDQNSPDAENAAPSTLDGPGGPGAAAPAVPNAGASAETSTPASPATTRQPNASGPTAAPAPAAVGTDATAPRPGERRDVSVPQGTAIPLELETPLSSETTQVEAPVRARVRQAIVVDGVVAIPTGATLSGVVTQVERAGRVQGRAQLAFVFTQLQADNVREDVQTAPLTYVAESSKGTDAAKIGAGAIGGAIIGGILGGGSGAARGAAIGGAAGTGVVLATRGSEVTLEKGTALAASLTAPLTLRVTAR